MSAIDLDGGECATIAFCSVRYAMGRRTYVVGDVCALVKRLRPMMLESAVTTLLREIERAIAEGRTGDAIDEAEWRALVEVLR